MKNTFLSSLLVCIFTAMILMAGAAPDFRSRSPREDYPMQRPLTLETIDACRGPEYSDKEFRAMIAVKDVAEIRERFPGSYLFVPSSRGPHPGILMLHGSGGGRYTPGRACIARFYASRGYATLAFCYSDCGDDRIPEALADIDLRRTYEAFVWLKRSPYVGGSKVALTGASRGAEQASLLASLLGRAAKTDSTILVPDALYASAPYGRVVRDFNWRRNPEDERWQKTRTLWEDCRDSRASGCDRRPALEPSECWVDDPLGRYQGPDGRRRSWVTSRCAAEANRPGQIFDRPAWRWDLDPAGVKPDTEINLADYSGPILVVHGAVDPIWSVEAGADHLRGTLLRHGVRSHRQTVPKYQQRIGRGRRSRTIACSSTSSTTSRIGSRHGGWLPVE